MNEDLLKLNEEAVLQKENKIGHIIFEKKEIVSGGMMELTCMQIDQTALDMLIPQCKRNQLGYLDSFFRQELNFQEEFIQFDQIVTNINNIESMKGF